MAKNKERATTNLSSPGEEHPQERMPHDAEWQHELNPNHMAGQNIGPASTARETGLPSAYDVKDVHRSLRERFDDADLKQIPVIPEGERLQQGATYIDLTQYPPTEFTAMGHETAETGHRVIPKAQVPYEIWNRLIGEEKPVGRNDPDLPSGQRLDAASREQVDL